MKSLRQKIVALILTFFMVVSSVALVPATAQAQFSIPNLERIEQGRDVGTILLDILGGVVRNTLNSVLSKLAYDAAVFIASGGKGQESLIFSQTPEEYFTDVGGAAVGGAIDGFAEGSGFSAQGLCDPGGDSRIDISIGLEGLLGDVQERKPESPSCTLTELKGNWEEAFSDPDFSNMFELQFDSTSNPLGVSIES